MRRPPGTATFARLSGGAVGGGNDAGAVFAQGLIFWNAGRLDEAISLFEKALKLIRAKRGEDHPLGLYVRGKLAAAYTAAGRVDEAKKLTEKAQ